MCITGLHNLWLCASNLNNLWLCASNLNNLWLCASNLKGKLRRPCINKNPDYRMRILGRKTAKQTCGSRLGSVCGSRTKKNNAKNILNPLTAVIHENNVMRPAITKGCTFLVYYLLTMPLNYAKHCHLASCDRR